MVVLHLQRPTLSAIRIARKQRQNGNSRQVVSDVVPIRGEKCPFLAPSLNLQENCLLLPKQFDGLIIVMDFLALGEAKRRRRRRRPSINLGIGVRP